MHSETFRVKITLAQNQAAGIKFNDINWRLQNYITQCNV